METDGELQKICSKYQISFKINKSISSFKCKLEIKLIIYASPHGIGTILNHIYPSGDGRSILNAFKSLNRTEKNYSQIEREVLAIIFGVKKFHQYL